MKHFKDAKQSQVCVDKLLKCLFIIDIRFMVANNCIYIADTYISFKIFCSREAMPNNTFHLKGPYIYNLIL